MRREADQIVRAEATDVLPAVRTAEMDDLLVTKDEGVESRSTHRGAVLESAGVVVAHE